MKTLVQTICCVLFLSLSIIDLSGCGSPPPPPSAKKQIKNAEEAIDSGNALVKLRQYELAVVEYEKALSEIRSAEGFATGNEAARLDVLKDEARGKKVTSEFEAKKKASEASARPKPSAGGAPDNSAQIAAAEAAKRKAEQAKEAEAAASQKAALESITKAPKPQKKPDEPEDAGDPVAAKSKVAKAGEPDAPKAPVKEPLKDKNGIFANIDDNTPAVVIPKLQRIGNFVIAYCQVYNKTDNGKRVTIYNFFKDRDNQLVIPQLTTASFPYERFSTKVKDLIGDQSVNHIAPNAEEINGHEYLQFVSVGECANEATAARVTKLYLDIRFSDGTQADLTSTESGAAAMPVPKINLPK